MKKYLLYLFLLFGFSFLFTTNTKAYTIYDDLDEQKIYEIFTSTFDFDINQYPYIYCDNYYFTTKSRQTTRCFALERTFLDNFSPEEGTHNYLSDNGTTYSFFSFHYHHDTNTIGSQGFSPNITGFWTFFQTNTAHINPTYYSNFNFKELTAEENSQYNVLDFSEFMSSSGDSNNNDNGFVVYSDSNYTIDEKFIYNTFKSAYIDFTFEEFPYVKCSHRYSTSRYVTCSAVDKRFIDALILYAHQSSYGYYQFKNEEVVASSVSFYYDIESGEFTKGVSIDKTYPYYSGSVVSYDLHYKSNHYIDYTNYNPSLLPGVSSDYNTKVNKLDFSKYQTNLQFDENLFANDENFKKVCVDENTKFSITPANGNYSDDGIYTDFIWFPYGLNNGLYKIQYDSSSEYFEGNVIIDTKEVQYENFYFSDFETINSFYDTDLPSDLEEAGYTDKYKYYGYNAYKFFIVYKDGLFRYPIYVFDNPSKTHVSTSGNIHGGGGNRLDGDEEIEITTEYCFYIKKDYEVNEVHVDEWGDFYGSVISPDGDYDFNTSYNKTNTDSDSFLSQPIKFISEMTGTITFLNTNIYNLYMSMPLVVRAFLITALIILIVMLIMKIGGYK